MKVGEAPFFFLFRFVMVKVSIFRTRTHWARGSQLGFRVYEIQNRGMILADSSLILLILQSRFSLNFGWFRPNLTDSKWFLLILTDSGFKIDYFSSDYCVILSDSEQGCTKIVLSCDPLEPNGTKNFMIMKNKIVSSYFVTSGVRNYLRIE